MAKCNRTEVISQLVISRPATGAKHRVYGEPKGENSHDDSILTLNAPLIDVSSVLGFIDVDPLMRLTIVDIPIARLQPLLKSC